MTGVVRATGTCEKQELRTIRVVDNSSGEEIVLKIALNGTIKQGTEIECIYLPHTKYAKVTYQSFNKLEP